MKKSDIFDNFVKIAEENSKKVLENNPRVDSLSAKEIAKLYNVKPEQSPDQKYENNMFEAAHPEPVVLFNAYDKLNGLIENNIERQNILLRILNKPTNGNITGHKYASNLATTLVKISNTLKQDNANIARVSDFCLTTIEKKALGPVAIVGIASTLLGALYAQQHLANINAGFERNSVALIKELEDFINSTSSFGVGYKFKANFIEFIKDFKNKLSIFDNLYKELYPLIENINKPRTAKELLDLSKTNGTEVAEAYTKLKNSVDEMLPYLETVSKNFANKAYKEMQIEEKGFLTDLADKTFLHGGQGLIADDFDDVINAITPYKNSLVEMYKVLKSASSLQEKAKKELEEAEGKSKTMFDEPKTKEDIDKGIGELIGKV